MSLATRIKSAAVKHSEYRRILSELRSMPMATMLDLDLSPADFPRIAHKAVYGA